MSKNFINNSCLYNATEWFHTHPNLGKGWVKIHSYVDINITNTVVKLNSYVMGRQNVCFQFFFRHYYPMNANSTIYAGNRLIAIFAKDNANPNGKVYYIHQDHLGSYDIISSDSKTVVERQHFDPWGNRKNPANWNIPDTRTSFLFDRGFTGHEYLDAFAIINMNARLYDPVIGRFFSPDPYVQAPGSTQGFNRYSYCMNNPLMYTDPDGEFILTFLINGFIGLSKGEGFWKSGGQAVWNQMKIIGGLFTTDKNRSGGGQFGEFVSRFTWQGIQTGFGLLYSLFANMVGQIDNVSYKAGATVMSGNFWGTGSAITIGNYIHGNSSLVAAYDNWLFQHEYGHYLQSQAAGPFFLQRYGIPSMLSGGVFKNGYHDFHPVEQDANARAFKYFSTKISAFKEILGLI